MRGDRGREQAQNFRRDVGEDDVCLHRRIGEKIGEGDARDIFDVVEGAVVFGAFDGDGIEVGKITALCPELGGGNAQNAAAAADVEDGIPLF